MMHKLKKPNKFTFRNTDFEERGIKAIANIQEQVQGGTVFACWQFLEQKLTKCCGWWCLWQFFTVPWSTSYFIAGDFGRRKENQSYTRHFGELTTSGRLYDTSHRIFRIKFVVFCYFYLIFVKTAFTSVPRRYFDSQPPNICMWLENSSVFVSLDTLGTAYLLHGLCEMIPVFQK